MRRGSIPPEQTLVIARRYAAGESSTTLAAECGCHPHSVMNWCRRHGITLRPVGSGSRRYTLNETYFDTIDTEEKAYWLGMLGADGHISSGSNGITLGLSGDEDKPMLHRFAEAIESDAPVAYHPTSYPGAKPPYRVMVSSARTKADLVRHGVGPRKSLTYQLNQTLPSHLMRHYVRGYFDGDGSASHKRDGGFLVSVTSSPDCIAALALVLQRELGLNPHIESKTQSRAHNLKIGGPFVCFVLLDWLYRDATIYMPRKHAKWLVCKAIVETKLREPSQFYNLYTHPETMANATRCAKLLNIPFDMTAYNGLSSTREEQDHILALYRGSMSVRAIGRSLKCSNTLVRNTLSRNGVAIRTPREATIARRAQRPQ